METTMERSTPDLPSPLFLVSFIISFFRILAVVVRLFRCWKRNNDALRAGEPICFHLFNSHDVLEVYHVWLTYDNFGQMVIFHL